MKRDLICPECKKKGFASKTVDWKEGGKLKCYHCGEWSNAEDWSLPSVWVRADERLPTAGKKVICYFNHYGKDRRIMAFHAPSATIEDDNELEASEYVEEKYRYFLREGWYEMNEFDETHWMVSNEITHWMDLPSVPMTRAAKRRKAKMHTTYQAEFDKAVAKYPPELWSTMHPQHMHEALLQEASELHTALWNGDLDGEHGIIRESIHVEIVARRIREEMTRRRGNELF